MDKFKEILGKRWVQITIAVIITMVVMLLIGYVISKRVNGESKQVNGESKRNVNLFTKAEIEAVNSEDGWNDLFEDIYSGKVTIKEGANISGIPYSTFHKKYHKFLKVKLDESSDKSID